MCPKKEVRHFNQEFITTLEMAKENFNEPGLYLIDVMTELSFSLSGISIVLFQFFI